ncbi:hypothetical protein Aduo_018634 [Ancylostoma duodenale]
MVVNASTYNYNTSADGLLSVLLDSGSQHSYLRESSAAFLGLELKDPKEVTTLTFGGHKHTEISYHVDITLMDEGNKPVNLKLLTRESITTVPPYSIPYHQDPTFQGVEDSSTRVDIDILVGIDYYWDVVDLVP